MGYRLPRVGSAVGPYDYLSQVSEVLRFEMSEKAVDAVLNGEVEFELRRLADVINTVECLMNEFNIRGWSSWCEVDGDGD